MLGLLAFSAEFINGGLSQTRNYERQSAQARKAGLPVTPEFVRACGWLMFSCGIAVNIPFLRRPAALILALLLPPITYAGHRFWEIEDEAQRRNQLTQFCKNATMFGGALYIASSK
jgi:uncharacterized membrane protein YphA (DoxX/SURF4 family)